MRISDWSSDVCSSDLKPAVALAIFQRPGTNALETAEQVIATMERVKQDFPPGLDYSVVYNPTQFIAESIDAVYETLFEAVVLVVLVVLVFLQSWRTARSEEHTSELQSLMRISYAVFCLKKKKK